MKGLYFSKGYQGNMVDMVQMDFLHPHTKINRSVITD